MTNPNLKKSLNAMKVGKKLNYNKAKKQREELRKKREERRMNRLNTTYVLVPNNIKVPPRSYFSEFNKTHLTNQLKMQKKIMNANKSLVNFRQKKQALNTMKNISNVLLQKEKFPLKRSMESKKYSKMINSYKNKLINQYPLNSLSNRQKTLSNIITRPM